MSAIMWLRHFMCWNLLVVFTAGYEQGVIGDHVNGSVSSATPVSFFYTLSERPTEKTLRVTVESDNASIRHPVLITIRQSRGVVSWTIPHVESGYSYSFVEQTLCPLLNAVDSENETAQLLVDITTSSTSPLGFSLVTRPVEDYRLELNKTISLSASPSAPAFYVFEYPQSESRVRIKFSSMDATSSICAIASIQSTYCPMVELLDNPDHRGTYQTMKSTAAIFQSQTEQSQFDFLYVVVTVLPNNDDFSSCQSTGQILTDSRITLEMADNFNPLPFNGSERVKHINITIETTLSDSGYIVATVVSTVVFMSFYIIALVWIIIFDWWRYNDKYLTKQLKQLIQLKQLRGNIVSQPTEPPVINLEEPAPNTGADNQIRSHTSSNFDPDKDQTDAGIRPVNRRHSNSCHSDSLDKRPNVWSILTGRHWNSAINKVSPRSARVPSFRRYKSHSESHSSNLHTSSHQLRMEDTTRNRQLVQGTDEVDHHLQPSADNNCSSDTSQDIEAARSQGSTTTVQITINIPLSELSEFDETSFVQKKYNRLSWYVLSVIIFYGIPAFQLVLTYQQLSNIGGNQDICYYNTLCSHPWRVSSNITIRAFNNVFSNIGYFILGLLIIFIAYRRRTIYRAFEHLNEDRDRDERVGVPQHFGIYYAVGLALMAEAFMSMAYHICPSNTNYQFDTTFMFVIAGLGLFKLIECRCPDLDTPLHRILFILAVTILLLVFGVLYSSSVEFYAVFFIIYVLSTLVISVEGYYRWQLKPTIKSMKVFYHHFKHTTFVSPPLHIPKFVNAVLSILLNLAAALYAVIARPLDFGTFFLAILVVNFLLQLIYYVIVKCIYREWPSLRPIVFVCLAVIFWIIGGYFYTRAVTNWLESPAASRDGNEECLILGFFDSHDMWHFVSAFALFFSFLMLMTLDDNQEETLRTKLRVF